MSFRTVAALLMALAIVTSAHPSCTAGETSPDIRRDISEMEGRRRALLEERTLLLDIMRREDTVLLNAQLVNPQWITMADFLRDFSGGTDVAWEFTDIDRWPVILVKEEDMDAFVAHHLLVDPEARTKKKRAAYVALLREEDGRIRSRWRRDIDEIDGEIADIGERLKEMPSPGVVLPGNAYRGRAEYSDEAGSPVEVEIYGRMWTDTERQDVRYIRADAAYGDRRIRLFLEVPGKAYHIRQDGTTMMHVIGTADIEGYRQASASGRILIDEEEEVVRGEIQVEEYRYGGYLNFEMEIVK